MKKYQPFVAFGKINCNNEYLCEDWEVKSVPSLYVFRKGKRIPHEFNELSTAEALVSYLMKTFRLKPIETNTPDAKEDL
jgi:hypothetical protein